MQNPKRGRTWDGSLKDLGLSLVEDEEARDAPTAVPDGRGWIRTPDGHLVPRCFAEVVRRYGSTEPAHVQQRAALEALRLSVAQEEGVEGRGSNSTSTASSYMFAILLAMDRIVEAGGVTEDNVALLGNLMFLEILAMREASQGLIRRKAAEILKVVLRVVSGTQQAGIVLRHGAACITIILSTIDSNSWTQPTVQRAFNALLLMVCNENPKVRRRAREGIGALFSGPRKKIIAKNSARAVSSFSDKILTNPGHGTDMAHLLMAVPVFLVELPLKYRSGLVENVVRAYSTSRPHISSLCLLTLSDALDAKSDLLDAKDIQSSLLPKLLSRLPGGQSGNEALSSYVKFLGSLARSCHESLDEEYKPQVIARLVDICDYSSSKGSQSLLTEAILAAADIARLRGFNRSLEALEQYIKFMSRKYMSFWKSTSRPLVVYLDHMREDDVNGPLRIKIGSFLAALSEARSQLASSTDRKYVEFIDKAMAAALRSGWFPILEKLNRMSIDKGEGRVHNAHMLILYRDNVERSKLSDYHETLLGLESELNLLANSVEASGGKVEAKNLRVHRQQVIDCLPAFCRLARDVKLCSTRISSTLSQLLSSGEELDREVGRRAISNIIDTSLEADADRKAFVVVLRELVPLILASVEQCPPSNRHDATACVTTAFEACNDSAFSTKELMRLLGEIMSSLSSDELSEKHEALLECCVAIYLAETASPLKKQAVTSLQHTLVSLISSTDVTAIHQKHAYKALARLLSSGKLLPSGELASLIVSASEKVSAGSAASRMRCLLVLAEYIKDAGMMKDFAQRTFVEIALATRDPSKKARTTAFSLLVTSARRMRVLADESRPGPSDSGLCQYLDICMGGLAATSTGIIATTLTALARLIHEFRGEAAINPELSNRIDIMVITDAAKPSLLPILLRHDSHEVVRAALSFLKVLCASSSGTRLAPMIPVLLPSLLTLYLNSRNEIRLRVRVILDRFMRKCNSSLESCFPEEHKKLLDSLRKERERTKRKRATSSHEEAGDVEDRAMDNIDEKSDTDSLLGIHDTPSSKGPAILRLDQESLDLLDHEMPAFKARTTAKGHSKESKRKRTPTPAEDYMGFKLSHDGRPIFMDSEDEDEKVATAQPDRLEGSDEELDEKEATFNPRQKKRARQTSRSGPSVHLGEEYRNKKGSGGDIKVRGRPDPYAFFPLGASFRRGKGDTRKQVSRKNKSR